MALCFLKELKRSGTGGGIKTEKNCKELYEVSFFCFVFCLRSLRHHCGASKLLLVFLQTQFPLYKTSPQTVYAQP